MNNNEIIEIRYSDFSLPYPPIEVIVVILTTLFQLAQVVIAVTILYYKDYPPFKAKQPFIIFSSVISAFIYFVSELYSSMYIPNYGNVILEHCNLWKVWLHFGFGFYLFTSMILYRLARLYIIFKVLTKNYQLSSRENKWKVNAIALLIIYLVPILGCVAVSFEDDWFAHLPVMLSNGETITRCYLISKRPLILVFSLIGLYQIILYFILIVLLRRIRGAFNEFDSNKITLIAFIVIGVFTIVLWVVGPIEKQWTRICGLVSTTLITSIYLYMVIGSALIEKFINPEAQLKRFKSSLAMTELPVGDNNDEENNGGDNNGGNNGEMTLER